MSTETEQRKQPIEPIREEVSTRAIEALIGNYKDPQQAFLELIDNAVDNREEGLPLLVRIRVSKNELSVYNQGGKGLDLLGLRQFFVWGYHQPTDTKTIGFYGVGGKAAMGYLGRSMEVRCSPKGSQTEYRVFDPSWETREEGQWKEFLPEISSTDTEAGYFRVRINNLKREVSAQALSTKLAEIYRRLILGGLIKVTINGKEVEPFQIKYLESDRDLRSQPFNVQTKYGNWIDGQFGILEEGQRGIKPGVRLYYMGRLIEIAEGHIFGLPQIPQLERFIGETYLDFVPVTTNKSSFDKGSVQYIEAIRRIQVVLTTAKWAEKLVRLKIEHSSPVESFEKDLAKSAKRVLEHVFATTGLVTKAMLPTGESIGRRPPTLTHTPPEKPGRKGNSGPKEGRTAPTIDATIGEIKRWGAMFAWEVEAKGSDARPVDVVSRNGREILVINSDYPFYQANKKAGDPALEMYMVKLGIMKISEIVTRDKSIEDYIELVERLERDCGSIYQSRIKERGRASRGTIHFNKPK